MSYRGAWECAKCPKTADPEATRACPAWWEVTETNTQTGEIRQQKGCAFQLMPLFLVEVMKASNRPAAAINVMANSIVQQLVRMEQANGNPPALPNSHAGQFISDRREQPSASTASQCLELSAGDDGRGC